MLISARVPGILLHSRGFRAATRPMIAMCPLEMTELGEREERLTVVVVVGSAVAAVVVVVIVVGCTPAGVVVIVVVIVCMAKQATLSATES